MSTASPLRMSLSLALLAVAAAGNVAAADDDPADLGDDCGGDAVLLAL